MLLFPRLCCSTRSCLTQSSLGTIIKSFISDCGILSYSELSRLPRYCVSSPLCKSPFQQTGDEKLSEEAVHLAAGLMLAGYSGVVATMWSIKDKDAPVIADHVYTELFSDGEPDSTGAAVALHHAVKLLRQKVGDTAFSSWVPFIHIGV